MNFTNSAGEIQELVIRIDLVGPYKHIKLKIFWLV